MDQKQTSKLKLGKAREILQQVYKEHGHLSTLSEYFGRFQEISLSKMGDTERYQMLLETCMVACCEETPTLMKITDTEQKVSTEDLIKSVIVYLQERNQSTCNNVLLNGIGRPSDTHETCVDLGVLGFKLVSLGGPSAKIAEKCWQTLHSRIGDQCMMHLLKSMSLFVPKTVSNGNYVQLTGPPIVGVVSGLNQSGKLKISNRKRYAKWVKHLLSAYGSKRIEKKVVDGHETENKRKKTRRKKKKLKLEIRTGQVKQGYSYHRMILRPTMFYSTDLRDRFFSRHILSKLTVPREKVVDQILCDILSEKVETDNQSKTVPNKQCKEELVRILVIFHKKHQYVMKRSRFLLNKFCLPASGHPISTTQSVSTVSDLLGQFLYRRQVYGFLRSLILKIIPLEMFGSIENRSVFLQHVHTFIHMTKNEKYTVGMVMTGIKIVHHKWLGVCYDQYQRERLVSKLYTWLLYYVILLVRSFFYVTESSEYRNRIIYYRKQTWKQVVSLFVKDHIDGGVLKEISPEMAQTLLKDGKALGTGIMRFLPKLSSLRPITNLSKKQVTRPKYKLQSVNHQLKDLLWALQFLQKIHPGAVGAGINGPQEFSQKFLKFVSNVDEQKKLYFVKVDIEKCFDNIIPDKMVAIIEELFSKIEDDTFIYECSGIVQECNQKIIVRYHREAYTLSEHSSQTTQSAKAKSAIVLDKTHQSYCSKDNLLKLLRRHLQYNLVNVCGHHYQQVKGISQGSVISSILCNFYYGDLEQKRFQPKPDELLVRQVDDYLFITPHLRRASGFLSNMLKGITEYNLKVNPSKTETNIPTSYLSQNLDSTFDKDEVSWCGMTIDVRHHQVAPDYSRYGGLSINDLMTLDVSRNPGVAIWQRVMRSMENKSHSIFFHSKLNDRTSLLRKIYTVFSYLALVVQASVKKLPSQTRYKNKSFLLSCVLQLPASFKMTANIRLHQSQDKLSLSHPELQWLCYEAFISILSDNSAQYKFLLSSLKWSMQTVTQSMSEALMAELDGVKEQGIPQDLRLVMV